MYVFRLDMIYCKKWQKAEGAGLDTHKADFARCAKMPHNNEVSGRAA